MKVIRFILIGFLALAGLMAIALVVAYNSSFQTWATNKKLAEQRDFIASAGRVDATLNRVHVEQFSVKRAGISLSMPTLDIDLPLISAARSDLQIKKLVAKGWTLDLTKPAAVASLPKMRSASGFSLLSSAFASEPTTNAQTIFQGVMSQLKLPVDLAVDQVELEGEVILPSALGQPPVRTKLTVSGGQLGAGREGRFSFTTATTLAPVAPVNAVSASGTLTAAMDTPRTFSRLGADLQAEGRGAQFPDGTRLSFVVSAARANAGESYTLVVESAGRKLVTVQASYAGGIAGAPDRPLEGTWMLDATAEDVSPFMLGRPLPAFVAKGSGRFTADSTLSTFSLNGRLDSNADKLETVRPELAAIGATQLGAEFDLMHSGTTLRVSSLTLVAIGKTPVLSVRALQPFEFNSATGELKVADPSKDLLNLELQGLPLAWVQPFTKDFAISGDDVRGSFLVGARNGGFAVRPIAPLSVANLSVVRAGKPLVRAIDASLKIAADYAPQGWQAELSEVSVRSGPASLLTFEAKAGQLSGKDQPIKVTGQWSSHLPALTAQPMGAHYAALIGGEAKGNFVASVGAKRALQANLVLTSLAVDPKVAVMSLPAVQVDLRADADESGKITLNVPLLLEREGRKSDLTLAGTVTPRPATWEIDGRATSTYLAAEDAQVLAAPFAAKADPSLMAEAPSHPAATRDTIPVWSGLSGKISLMLKKVVYQQKFEVSDVSGAVQIDAGGLKVEGLHAGLGEGSDLKLGGAVTFDGKAKDPYELRADFTLANFDTVPLFRALDPGKPATVEGKFNASSQLAGSGINFIQLLEHTRGDLQLTSKSGVSRLLSADVSDKIQKASSTLSAIGGLLGSVTGKEKMGDFANKGQIVADIATALKEVPYDQFNVAVTRGTDLNFNLKDFTLIAPEVRLTGTGEIRHDEGVPVLAQPLNLKLLLGTRGKLADLMTRAALLDGTQDNLGYAGFISPLRIAGTVENPDTTDIRNVLIKAATGGSLLNKLGL